MALMEMLKSHYMKFLQSRLEENKKNREKGGEEDRGKWERMRR